MYEKYKKIVIIIILLLVAYALYQNFAYSKSEDLENIDSSTYQAVPVGIGPDALFVTADEQFLYIANVEDTFVSIIDTSTDTVVKELDTVDYPWGFASLGDTNLLALSGWDKGVDIIDTSSQTIVRSKHYDFNLGGIVATGDGSFLYVVGTETNTVYKLSAGTLEVIDTYQTGAKPDGIGISSDEKLLYVTNTADGSISVINTVTKEVILIEVGGKPELVHSNKDRSLLYISNFPDNRVDIINTATSEVVATIEDIDGPEETVLSASGDILYVVSFWKDTVYTYNALTFEKLDKEYLVGAEPIGIIGIADDNKLYVSNFKDNSVSIIEDNNAL